MGCPHKLSLAGDSVAAHPPFCQGVLPLILPSIRMLCQRLKALIGADKTSSKPNPQTEQPLVCCGLYGQGERDVLKPLPSPGSGFVIHIPMNYFVAIAILFHGPNPFSFTGKPFTFLSRCSGAFTLANYLSNCSLRLCLLSSTNLD